MDMHRHHYCSFAIKFDISQVLPCLKKDYALEEHICVVKKIILD